MYYGSCLLYSEVCAIEEQRIVLMPLEKNTTKICTLPRIFYDNFKRFDTCQIDNVVD
jgi:hypothetical protein